MMRPSSLYALVLLAVIVLLSSHAFADTPEDAVKKAFKGEVGMTDIGGDGLNVLPVAVQKKDGVTTVTGTIRHTYKKPLEPTLVDYVMNIKGDGSVDGTLTIHKAKNGDRIEQDIQGTMAGKIGQIKSPQLEDARWKRGVRQLLSLIGQEAGKQ